MRISSNVTCTSRVGNFIKKRKEEKKKRKNGKVCKRLTVWRKWNRRRDTTSQPACRRELERNNREPPLWLQEIADPLMDLKQGMETLRVNKTFRGILSTLLSIGIFLNGNEVGIECQPNDIRLIRQSESVVRVESISIDVDNFRVTIDRWFKGKEKGKSIDLNNFLHKSYFWR